MCNILTGFAMPTKLVQLIRTCIKETCEPAVKFVWEIAWRISYSERSEARTCVITTAFKLRFRISRYKGSRILEEFGIEWGASTSGLC